MWNYWIIRRKRFIFLQWGTLSMYNINQKVSRDKYKKGSKTEKIFV